MQETIKIIPVNAEVYPAFYKMVQTTRWGNLMLPIDYSEGLWGAIILQDNQLVLGGWVGIIRGNVPLARIITKSVYFDSCPIFINECIEIKYYSILLKHIKQYAIRDNIVMLNLTHWVRKDGYEIDVAEKNASFVTELQTTEEVLWKQVESKQRNCIRKGEKSGVKVEVCRAQYSLKYLDDFQKIRMLTQQHAIGKNKYASMLLKSDEFFKKLFLLPTATLFVGKIQDQVAIVALMIQSGQTVYYYSGGSDYELNRQYSCSAYVIWQAICYYNNLGVRFFDMGGVPVNPNKEHPAYGVYAFKRSFGGEYMEFEGGYIIISSWKYKLLQFILSQRKLLRFFSTKI